MSRSRDRKLRVESTYSSVILKQTSFRPAVEGARLAMSDHGMHREPHQHDQPEQAPPVPVRNQSFESYSATKLDDIVAKLEEIYRHMQTSEAGLETNLPMVLRTIVQDELRQARPAAQVSYSALCRSLTFDSFLAAYRL